MTSPRHAAVLGGNRISFARANGPSGEAAGEVPLHHAFPTEGPPLSRQFGRGTPRRSKAGMAALKQTQRMPEPVLRAAMRVLGPPERAPRR